MKSVSSRCPSPVLILYNGDGALAGGHDAEAVLGVRDSATAIEAALLKRDIPAQCLPVVSVDDIIREVRQCDPALIVNLVESVQGRSEHEASACGVLELLGAPYTGSSPMTLGICQNKPLTKSLCRGLGITTANWVVIRPEDIEGDDAGSTLQKLRSELRFPCIVKPAATDGSHGIGPESVVFDEVAAIEQAARLWERYGHEVLVEEFIAGREINVAIVGNGSQVRCLPMSEIVFRTPMGVPPIVTYGAKWVDDSPEWGTSEVQCPADLNKRLREELERAAERAFRGLGCRDYARVDFRISQDGIPHLLEVNPNPDLAPDAGFARSARTFRWSYDDLVHHILDCATLRTGAQDRVATITQIRPGRGRGNTRANRGLLPGRDRLRAVPPR